jgi:beta-glucosidase-like glycosyl hydrolase
MCSHFGYHADNPQQVPGEDPVLTGQYAVNFVRGLQEGVDPDHVQIVACCKHFVANSLEDWNGHTRHNFDANISKADLANYYLPAFRACVMEGKSLGIMCSYNSVNGKPSCANDWLLETTLRETWGFEGYVTSDCGAIEDIYTQHNYTTDGINATAQSIAAGTDVDCGGVYSKFLSEAVQKRLLTHDQVDRSFSRLVDIQMRLGLFDKNKEAQPYFNYGYDDIDTAAHQTLALEAAQQSIVLLKNDNGVLPLKAGRTVAVIGPHTYSTEAFLSNYHGSRCPGGGFSCIPTALAAITSANVGGTTVGSLGCNVNSKHDNITAAVTTASSADSIVLMVGIDGSQENEGKDRINTTLPGLQTKLVNEIIALQKPTVLVLVSGGTLSLGPLKDSANAIVSAAYGGERAAEAIANVLFGAYNPSGKLAATMYPPEYVDEIPLTEMGLQVPPGRTHMFYTGHAEFPFGHGLSYTRWGLGWANKSGPSQSQPEPLRLHTTASRELGLVGENLKFDIAVSNLGDQTGKQTVLLFLVLFNSTQNSKTVPLRQKLLAYESAQDVLPGQQRILRFRVDTLRLAAADANGNMVVTSGEYILLFRDGQNALRHTIIIHGPPIVVTRFPEGGGGGEEEGSQTAILF